MTDREMLELAAKAAGIVIVRSRLDDPLQRDMLVKNSFRNPCQEAGAWNPLTDDGDALRLAVKLWISMTHESSVGLVYCDVVDTRIAADEEYGADPYAATRRAIVRAAAVIGGAG